MANTLANGDIVLVNFYCYAENQLGMFGCHFRMHDPFTLPDPTDQDMADYMDSTISATLKQMLSDDASYLGASAQVIWPTRKPRVVSVTGAGIGTQLGVILPKQVAFVITKRSNSASRSGLGRMYIPFPPDSQNESSGNPSNAYTALAGTLKDLLLVNHVVPDDTMTGSGEAQPIIWHRATSTYDDIVSSTYRDRWATQRRRGDYGAVNELFPG